HCGISPVWCGVHPTQCPRRTSASAVFMSHGDDTLTGPECSWSARRRTAGRSCLRERELGAQGAVTLVRSEERRVGKACRLDRSKRDWSSDVCSSDLHCGISPVWCGVHPTQCPRRTSASAVFMSHGDVTLTGPECSWSARRRTAGRSCLRERELGAQGAVTLVARVPDHHKHSRAESANPAADGRRRGAQPSSPSPPSPGISTATKVTAESYSSL